MRYQFKSAVSRGTAFVGALLFLGGIGTPALIGGIVSADALNPLTERSLLLSSSSPGFHYLDGSGNGTYAPPGSGPNGKKTGETFSFNVSTNSTNVNGGTNTPLQAFSLQYCTTAAGVCTAPGDDLSAVPRVDDTGHSDLNVDYTTPTEVATVPTAVSGRDGATLVPRDDSGGNFAIIWNGTLQTGWSMSTVTNSEDGANPTGKNNYVVFTNVSGDPLQPNTGDNIKLVFYATDNNYITNPGSGAFFVKINDYSDSGATTVVDGGVTVANVMTDSIQIQTKVLETMAFSVGTVDPDTQAIQHGTCDAITTNNPISLGDPTQESALDVHQAYDAVSYWRLSSNSSNGATVYYSGNTLSDTEGDHIAAISGDGTAGDGSEAYSKAGTEQFGLGLNTSTTAGPTGGDADQLDSVGPDDGSGNPDPTKSFTALAAVPGSGYNDPSVAPLVPTTGYGDAKGVLSNDATTGTSQFAFKYTSLTTPEPVATENNSVVHCSTGKMRYVANIAADTPAGIYTTKINYLAAPQY